VSVKNVHGAQFHPEKSGDAGRRMLKNFLRAVKR
jgi:imidazoleglycerol phosphate synthase glutamine amidotransferase subunit HisH